MTETEALSLMVPPGQARHGKWMMGVMQIHLTRACDLACSNCTQGSQFKGKPDFITLENFEKACQSLHGYFGLIGIFGGNPALHPQFQEITDILRKHFPKSKCGIWCNNPHGKAAIMRDVFNPAMSNLNCHLNIEAYEEFKRDWPESRPFGLDKDSRHSPVHGSLTKMVPDEEERWRLISQCDVNQHWSAMICQFRGELRAFFCEIAGSQAILNQHNPLYPDTGMLVEPGWWQRPMQDFAEQVRFHCHRCLVPLRGHGALAQQEQHTIITSDYDHLRVKGSRHELQLIDGQFDIHSETSRRVIDYLGR